ncbi:MAG: CNNM domain-containing protein [Planctomycetota bacterium]
MNDLLLALLALFVLLLFAISAFFSGSETALMAVNRLRLRRRADEGDVLARRAHALLEDTGRLLSGILLGNNFVNVLLASLSTAIAAPLFGELAPLYVSPILTILLLIFAEILPKTIAVERPMRIARLAATPIAIFIKVTSPMIAAITAVCSLLMRPFVSKTADGATPRTVSVEDLITFAQVGREEGSIGEVTHDLLHGLAVFSQERVRLVMVPRHELVSMPLSAGLEGFEALLETCGHTRIPVWNENEEDIIGVLHAKDLLHRGGRERASADLRAILRPANFIPESTTLARALRHMQASTGEMLFVVDEYGGLEGAVTLKDLLEELVGELEDEHDLHSGRRVDIVRPGVFVADARSSLRYIQRKTGIDLNGEHGASTLGGLIVARAQDELRRGLRIEEGDVTFTVLAMNGRFLKKVRVDAPPPAAEGGDDLATTDRGRA